MIGRDNRTSARIVRIHLCIHDLQSSIEVWSAGTGHLIDHQVQEKGAKDYSQPQPR